MVLPFDEADLASLMFQAFFAERRIWFQCNCQCHEEARRTGLARARANGRTGAGCSGHLGELDQQALAGHECRLEALDAVRAAVDQLARSREITTEDRVLRRTSLVRDERGKYLRRGSGYVGELGVVLERLPEAGTIPPVVRAPGELDKSATLVAGAIGGPRLPRLCLWS